MDPVPFLALILLLLMIQNSYSVSTASTVFHMLCARNHCRNGMCYQLHNKMFCSCGELFHGSRCEKIDTKAVQYDSIGSMAIFHWPRPPRLKGYSFVYYEITEKTSPVLQKIALSIKENENSATLSNLKGTGAAYNVCILDETVAELAVRQNTMELLSDCVTIEIYQGYFTLAGWSIAGIVAIAVVFLMYSQKGKIEILYYSRSYKTASAK